eukprot:4687943-Lingulodinium_polyedra.AAC.1
MDGPDVPIAAGSPRSYGPRVGAVGRRAGSSNDSPPQRTTAPPTSVEVPPGKARNRPPKRDE